MMLLIMFRQFKSPLTLSHLKGQTDITIIIEEEKENTTLSIRGTNKPDILITFRNVLRFLYPQYRIPALPNNNVDEMMTEGNQALILAQKPSQPLLSKSPTHFLPYRSCYNMRIIIPIGYMNIFLHPEYKRSKCFNLSMY